MEELKVKPLSPTKSPIKSPKRLPPPPLAARVKVAVRVRPPVNCNGDESPSLCITETNPETMAEQRENVINFQFEKTLKSFRFDHIFSSEAAQADVYNAALQPLLASFLHGFNVTVLAYGQTGSGKTHTVGGAENSAFGSGNDGLIPRFLCDLFDALRNEASMKTTAKVSFLEIYCDEIRDLLVDSERVRSMSLYSTRQTGSRLTIHEDNYDVRVEGLQQVKVKSVDEALNLLKTGRQRQTIGAHALNDQSSRSHAVYTLEVSRAFSNEIKRSKLTFVDLAGSERVKKTLMEGQGMKEGSHINIGLLALGNVINALGSKQCRLQRRNSTGISDRRNNLSGNDDSTALGAGHVPYRSSKLTRLLRDALGGNSVTLFIACISPEIANGNETLCTLQYANRARSIQNKALKNVEEAVNDVMENQASVVCDATESERIMYTLREQVAALKKQLEQAVAIAKATEARDSSLVGIKLNSAGHNEVYAADSESKTRKNPKPKRRLRIAPLELDIPEYTNTRDINYRLESEEREGVVNKSRVQQREAFSINSNSANSTNQITPKEQNPEMPELFTPSKPSARPNTENIACNEKTAVQSPSVRYTPQLASNNIQTGNGISVMIDQSTQYESPWVRKIPVDYVLLSPSQIFREVHRQKLKALDAPSPWPHRRRLDLPYNESRYRTETFPALNNKRTPNSKRTPRSKTQDVLYDLLRRTRQFTENSPGLWDLDIKPEVDEQKKGQQSSLSFETFVDRMTAIYDQRSRQLQFVRRLTQRFRHLATLLSIPDVDNQMNELSKYVLEHQLDTLQQHLETFERLAADRLWMRLQHREVAIENYAGVWNDKLAELFLSEDQYEACTPWHSHRNDHEFFQRRILPFVLNGWISVSPSVLENEQLWLTL